METAADVSGALVASDEQELSNQEQNFGPVVVANYRDDGEPSIPGT
jgi:hypothetical protein